MISDERCAKHLCRTLIFSFHLHVADSYYKAFMHAQKSRPVIPKNYSEQKRTIPTQRRLNNRQNPVTKLKCEIRIKSERISNLKKAIIVYNQQIDKRNVETIGGDDLAEFEALIDDDMVREREIETAPVPLDEESDDVLIIGNESEPIGQGVMLPGVEPLQVDRNFSLQYTYTTDVRNPNFEF